MSNDPSVHFTFCPSRRWANIKTGVTLRSALTSSKSARNAERGPCKRSRRLERCWEDRENAQTEENEENIDSGAFRPNRLCTSVDCSEIRHQLLLKRTGGLGFSTFNTFYLRILNTYSQLREHCWCFSLYFVIYSSEMTTVTYLNCCA